MMILRSALYLCGQVISAVIICFIMLICFPFSGLRDRIISSWAKFNLWTLRWLCGIRYRVQGLENIPSEPSIIISNHQSAWETLFFQLIFPPLSFVLKRQLLWIPFFGWGLAAYHPIAIDRSKKKRALDQLITQGAERLNAGRWLVIYPEGTRMGPGEPGKFQIGGAMIAAKTGAPIVPIAHNGGVFWAKRSFYKYPGTIDIVIGTPIPSQGVKARELNQQSEEWIKQTLTTLPTTR
ncbi:MAG: 1-acyl-sn-glycerol-3-phosphate acyltransferase [Acidiferrobacterales bacterium]|nr:1-acyl-sn-glycerol-3-phosphate acyltransferase [Acidiferrobacterales bacterium]